MGTFVDLYKKANEIFNITHSEENREDELTDKIIAFAKDMKPLADILDIAELNNSVVAFDDNTIIEVFTKTCCSESTFMEIREPNDKGMARCVKIPYDTKVIDTYWADMGEDSNEDYLKHKKECFDLIETVVKNSDKIAELLTEHTNDILDDHLKKLRK